MTSWIYRDPRVYRGVLTLLYGRALRERERIVAAEVPLRAEVVDACCGDGGIARRLRHARYLGLDASERFVRALRRRGTSARVLDVAREDVPEADVVLLLGSLYQFLPDADRLVERLRRAARRCVVVAEPFRNLARDGPAPVRAVARRMTDPGVASSVERFDAPSLRALFERQGARRVHETSRELIGVLPGLAS